MNICEDKFAKCNDSSLRNSKESISFGGSVTSKTTPQNNTSSNKQTAICSTKWTVLISSDKTKELSSATNTDVNKSEKVEDRNNTIKNCKSQAWFQKNPVYSTNKINRLK